jgi:NTE family protein
MSALLPEGTHDNQPLGDLMTRLHPMRWPARPLWITAVQLDTGARVAFGRPGAPLVDVATAVRCSSAVPGLRRPVRCGPHRIVDGGIASPTHLDLLAEGAPARAIVLSPLSRFWPLRRLLGSEVDRLRRAGTPSVLFEPDCEVAAAMGWNPMDARRIRAVAFAAYHSTRARLEARDAGALRAALFGAA